MARGGVSTLAAGRGGIRRAPAANIYRLPTSVGWSAAGEFLARSLMRIYDGSPRQDFEEVFRSIGAYLDSRGMREVLLTEAPDGFIVQGLVVTQAGMRAEVVAGAQTKETLTFLDDDISRFMDAGLARRGSHPADRGGGSGYYERSLRVIGHYLDTEKPRDVFFFEQDGNYVLRLLVSTTSNGKHQLFEFTKEDVERMIEQGPIARKRETQAGSIGSLKARIGGTR